MAGRIHPPYRSLFWPILLIGVGILWLLSTIGDIVEINLPVLFRLWPLLLIFIGLDFLLGRRRPLVGALLGLLIIALVVGFMAGGRVLGLSPDVQVKTEHFTAPLAPAKSAQLQIVLSDSPATVQALDGSTNLIDAQLTYVGTINFNVSGSEKKTVRLARNETDFLLFSPLYWDPTLAWQISLTSQIPLDLTLEGGSGSSQVDLSKLRVGSLKAILGSGSSHFIAPGLNQPAVATLRGGSGSSDWDLLDGAELSLTITGGSGSIQIHLPAHPAVRLDIRSHGSGSLSHPPDWVQTSGKGDEEGVWESPAYAQASRKIDIIIQHAGSGSITLATE